MSIDRRLERIEQLAGIARWPRCGEYLDPQARQPGDRLREIMATIRARRDLATPEERRQLQVIHQNIAGRAKAG